MAGEGTPLGDQMDEQRAIRRYVEPNPHRPGPEEARIVGYGVAVWALVGYLQAVDGDLDQVARDYGLPREAVEAALAYYREFKDPIDARIAANSAFAA